MHFKICSKNQNTYIQVVLLLQFISMDQLEKRLHTLFSGGNNKYEATYIWSCNYEDIQDKLISCEGCSLKLLKGENNKKYTKCQNWDITRGKYSTELIASVGGYAKKYLKQQKEDESCVFNFSF